MKDTQIYLMNIGDGKYKIGITAHLEQRRRTSKTYAGINPIYECTSDVMTRVEAHHIEKRWKKILHGMKVGTSGGTEVFRLRPDTVEIFESYFQARNAKDRKRVKDLIIDSIKSSHDALR